MSKEDQIVCLWRELGLDLTIAKQFSLDKFVVTPGNRKAVDFAKDLAWNHHFVTFQGDCGLGKTHLALVIAGRYINELQETVRYYQVPDLLEQLRNGYANGRHEDILNSCKKADLLILDDLGMQKNTEWTLDQLDSLIDYRYIRRKDTIFTTNKTLDELSPRIASRLNEGEVFVLTGKDYRCKIATNRDTSEGK
jgi:DNA replication protein DnaC